MPRNANSVWSESRDIIADEVSPHDFQTWFAPIQPKSYSSRDNKNELALTVPSAFARVWIRDNYDRLVRETVRKVIGQAVRITYRVDGSASSSTSKTESEKRASRPKRATHTSGGSQEGGRSQRHRPSARTAETPDASGKAETSDHEKPERSEQRFEVGSLHDRYTFERFIAGDCNELAYGAAVAIANEPSGTKYNPFLVYGGVGLGKTHLVQAIGHRVKAASDDQTVCYVSSEAFTSQFVRAIQNNNVPEFSDYYRNIDVLIVDDVQFFCGKEKTQEEFFHVFNALHQQGRQIVLCADRAPKEIEGIEDRLLSRFNWGLSADMQPPDLETRTAILLHKAEAYDITIEQNVIDLIARSVTTNIRDMEGALNRLAAYARFQGKEHVTPPMAKQQLTDVLQMKRRRLRPDEIKETVADYYQLPVDQLLSRTRTREVVRARQVAMYFCKELTDHTLKEIGARFGGRDHSTVIHSCRTVKDRMETEQQFPEEVEALQQSILAGTSA